MGNRTRKIAEILGNANHTTGKLDSANLDVNFENTTFTGTEGIKIPVGTTAQRGTTTGQWRYNSDTGYFEGRNAGGTFNAIAPAPTILSIDVTEIDSASGGTTNIVLTGTNFSSADTITLIPSSGSNITPNSYVHTNTSSKTINVTDSDFVSANEPYSVKIIGEGGEFTLENQINVDSAPTWTTSSGSLGTIDHTELPSSYTLTSVAASDVDGDTIAYTKTTGTFPTGLSLNSSTGAWSGTGTGLVNTTTYNFTLRATANSKTTDRAFSITQEGELDNYGTEYAFSFNGDSDNSGSNADSYTTAGSVVFNSTGQTKFNANSAYFTNSAVSRFTIPNSSDLQFGTGSFTIEGWVYLVNDSTNVSVSARVFQMGTNSSSGIALIHNYASEFMFGNTHTEIVGDDVSNWFGQWRYFTVDYDGTNLRLYRDGTVIDTATSGFNSVTETADLHFGVYPGDLTDTRSNMYLSEWQFTKGVAKYQGNFTPKVAAFLT